MTTKTEVLISTSNIKSMIEWFVYMSGYAAGNKDTDVSNMLNKTAQELKEFLPK